MSSRQTGLILLLRWWSLKCRQVWWMAATRKHLKFLRLKNCTICTPSKYVPNTYFEDTWNLWFSIDWNAFHLNVKRCTSLKKNLLIISIQLIFLTKYKMKHIGQYTYVSSVHFRLTVNFQKWIKIVHYIIYILSDFWKDFCNWK